MAPESSLSVKPRRTHLLPPRLAKYTPRRAQVILDVVYNHTAEGGDDDPYLLSFRGIDNLVYYQLNTGSYVQLLNYSGCGNTVSANHPTMTKMIIDSLVQWVEEYHVDGFRFDLASSLCRDNLGRPIPAPPLIRAIAKHPILSKVKLIAEPWDIGMYQVRPATSLVRLLTKSRRDEQQRAVPVYDSSR